MERVEVAPDRWTFRLENSQKPFVPFGTNYTPAWSGWPPDYLADGVFDEERVRADFARMQAVGANVCKVVFPLCRIAPDPQRPAAAALNASMLVRMDQLIEIAGGAGIRLIVTVEPSWHGFPAWFDEAGRWYGEAAGCAVADLWRQIATRYRDDGRVFAYSFCVETELDGWQSEPARAAWRAWAKARYETIEAANKAWHTAFGSWADVTVAGHNGRNAQDWRSHAEGTASNQNQTRDPFLYDYLLFREYSAFRYVHAQAVAVKQADPQALCSMGFVQWNPILRQIWAPNHEGPAVGPEYNVREMARALDFVGIHFYPVYPGGSEATQLKYLETWARWAYAGKPVVLEEFNQPPANVNVQWCHKVVAHSRRYVSGWLVWTFQDVPSSDKVTEVCGLFKADGQVSPTGQRFRLLAPDVTKWPLRRERAYRTVPVDKPFLYTSGRYREFIESILRGDSQAVDFECESNPSIDRLLAGHDLTPSGVSR